MRVSYVVTFYNKERFVPFVLASIEAQTGSFERECIFVDDGSTDGTVPAIRRETSGWGNVTILTQENAGPAFATNRGINSATGDIIKPIDGDDIIAPWVTQSALEAMEKTGLDAVFFRVPVVYYDSFIDTPAQVLGRFSPGPERTEVNRDPVRQSIRRSTVNPTAWAAKRSRLGLSGLCDEGVFIQDYSIELRIASSGAIAEITGRAAAFPSEAPGRLTDNKAQILHDVNMAAIRFVRARPDVSRDYRNLAMRRAAKRALAWEQRHGKLSRVPYLQWLYARSLMGVLEPSESVEAALCAPFRATGRVRLPTPSGAA